MRIRVTFQSRNKLNIYIDASARTQPPQNPHVSFEHFIKLMENGAFGNDVEVVFKRHKLLDNDDNSGGEIAFRYTVSADNAKEELLMKGLEQID